MLAYEVPVRLVDQGTDWPAWITAGFTAAATVGIGVAIWSLKDAKRTRHGMLVTEISRQWADPAVVESLKLYGKHSEKRIVSLVDKLFGPTDEKPSDDDRQDFSDLSVLANLIETMGVLVSEKTITDEIVYKMWGGTILIAWDAWDEAIPRLRRYDDEPDTFHYFEELADAMKRISAREKQKAAATGGSAASGPQADAKAVPETNGK